MPQQHLVLEHLASPDASKQIQRVSETIQRAHTVVIYDALNGGRPADSF